MSSDVDRADLTRCSAEGCPEDIDHVLWELSGRRVFDAETRAARLREFAPDIAPVLLARDPGEVVLRWRSGGRVATVVTYEAFIDEALRQLALADYWEQKDGRDVTSDRELARGILERLAADDRGWLADEYGDGWDTRQEILVGERDDFACGEFEIARRPPPSMHVRAWSFSTRGRVVRPRRRERRAARRRTSSRAGPTRSKSDDPPDLSPCARTGAA